MQKLTIFLFAFAVICCCEAKYFSTRCELVHELRRQGFPENQMRNWVCLIENESGRNTATVKNQSNGSRNYGLFQINDQHWCSNTNTPGKECGITCQQLLLDDISVASRCAQKIYNQQKFNAWYGWVSHCQGSLPDISNC